MKETSDDKLYQELGLELLADRKWFENIIFINTIILGLFSFHLQEYLNRKELS